MNVKITSRLVAQIVVYHLDHGRIMLAYQTLANVARRYGIATTSVLRHLDRGLICKLYGENDTVQIATRDICLAVDGIIAQNERLARQTA